RRSPYKTGDPVGYPHSQGYVNIAIYGIPYCAHVLAWLYMTGSWPKHQIDHINGARSDNRWKNLRRATPQQQACNSKVRKTNKTGVKGVWEKPNGKFLVYIDWNNKRTNLGTFNNLDEAKAIRAKWEEKLHREYRRTS